MYNSLNGKDIHTILKETNSSKKSAPEPGIKSHSMLARDMVDHWGFDNEEDTLF